MHPSVVLIRRNLCTHLLRELTASHLPELGRLAIRIRAEQLIDDAKGLVHARRAQLLIAKAREHRLDLFVRGRMARARDKELVQGR